MLRFFKRTKKDKLESDLADTDARLALMKAQLAAQMVKLAGQTDDIAPLKQAEEALSSARNYYTFENTPVEIGMVQVALGDMLMKLGQAQSDKAAIARANQLAKGLKRRQVRSEVNDKKWLHQHINFWNWLTKYITKKS